MSNFQTTVSIEDIYGKEWWERNREELNREWEWSFGQVRGGDAICDKTAPSIEEFWWSSTSAAHCRIILHRRKPKPPTLRDIYGVDKVTTPTGWEWTGEFRKFKSGDSTLDQGRRLISQWRDSSLFYETDTPRLILRERPKKVWFKCEAEPRVPRAGDWYYSYGSWCKSANGADGIYLCATRHEEPDTTVQTVTQADIDRLQKENN